MKKAFYILFLLTALLYGCGDIDNYDAPDASLKGKLIDLATKGSGNEKLIPCQAVSGAKIALYEGNFLLPTRFSVKTDGSFEGAMIFKGDYMVVPEGPFIVTSADSVHTHIPVGNDLDFYLEPFLRLEITDAYLDFAGTAVTVKFKIAKSAKVSARLARYTVVWANVPQLDINTQVTGSGAGKNMIEVNVESYDENDYLDKELTVVLHGVDPTRPVYVRSAARITGTNHFNYSTSFKVQ